MISSRTGSSTPHSAGAGEAQASPAIFDTGKVWPVAAIKRGKGGHQRVTDVFLAQHFEVIRKANSEETESS